MQVKQYEIEGPTTSFQSSSLISLSSTRGISLTRAQWLQLSPFLYSLPLRLRDRHLAVDERRHSRGFNRPRHFLSPQLSN
jgi:hypothetical protein